MKLFAVRVLTTVTVVGVATLTFASAPVSGQAWSVDGQIGMAVPNGHLDPIRGTGLAIQIGATYMLVPLVGFGANIGAAFMPDDGRPSDGGSLSTRGALRVVDLSAHVILIRPTGWFRPFARVSGGWYHLQALGQRTTTGNTPVGISGGVGVQIQHTHRFGTVATVEHVLPFTDYGTGGD